MESAVELAASVRQPSRLCWRVGRVAVRSAPSGGLAQLRSAASADDFVSAGHPTTGSAAQCLRPSKTFAKLGA
jgi:hypothetical protein